MKHKSYSIDMVIPCNTVRYFWENKHAISFEYVV